MAVAPFRPEELDAVLAIDPFWERIYPGWLEPLLSKQRAPECAFDCDPAVSCRACELKPGPTRHGWENAWPDPPGVYRRSSAVIDRGKLYSYEEALRLGIIEPPAPHLTEFDPDIHYPARWPELAERAEGGPLLLGARPLSEISTDPPPEMLIDRLDPESHSILYGTGGAGKGALTASWIVRFVRLGKRVLIVDYENHPTEWARRIYGLGGAEAVAGVTHVAPLTAGWTGVRGPLWVQAAQLRSLVEATGADYVVVDSLVPACAGFDPMKPEAAALYAGGLELIDRPVLSLAHVTKAEDLRYPFGSAFWHNLARTTWSLKRDGEQAILQHRKHNNYAGLGRFVVTMTWLDDKLGEVSEKGYSVVLADRIDEALADGPLTAEEIVARLNDALEDDEEKVKVDSVSKALRRGILTTDRKPQRYTVDGGKYRLVAQ